MYYAKCSKTLIVGIVLLIACISACEDQKRAVVSKNPDVTPFFYPLEVGSFWEYEGIVYRTNLSPDSLDPEYIDSTVVKSLIEIVSLDTLADLTEAYNFKETVRYGDDIFSGNCHMNNDGNFFIQYDNSLTGDYALPGKTNRTEKFRFMGREFNSVAELFQFVDHVPSDIQFLSQQKIISFTDEWVSLMYPLYVGSRWTSRATCIFGRLDKTITGTRSVETPAGRFNCFVIERQCFNEQNQRQEDFEHVDYLSEMGLVMRHIIVKDVMLVDENANVLGTFDAVQQLVLKECMLM